MSMSSFVSPITRWFDTTTGARVSDTDLDRVDLIRILGAVDGDVIVAPHVVERGVGRVGIHLHRPSLGVDLIDAEAAALGGGQGGGIEVA